MQEHFMLIVDGQVGLHRFIVQNFGEEYRDAETLNGRYGLKQVEELLPDLIISDVIMSDIDGFQLYEISKNTIKTSHIPILMLTVKKEKKDLLVSLETGADDYFIKPFSLKGLLREKLNGNVIPSVDKILELNHKDRKFVDDLELSVEINLSNAQFGVNILAEAVCLSASQLTRKLKTITGKTPANFIRSIRFEKAIGMLKDGVSVTETSWAIGFEDPVYFSKVFKKYFGFPPSLVKNK